MAAEEPSAGRYRLRIRAAISEELEALIGGPVGDRQVLAAWAKAHPTLWVETIVVLSAFIASEVRADLHRLQVSDEIRAFHDRLLLRRELIIAEELGAPLEDRRQP
jgi:hypothetical protein